MCIGILILYSIFFLNLYFIYNANQNILDVTKGIAKLVCENPESFIHSDIEQLCKKVE